MDTQTMLIIITISALVLIAGLVIAFKSQVEAGAVSSWWIVTAQWSDPETGRMLTFRSRRLNFPPHHHIGEHVVVNFDANEPKRHRMEL